MKSSCRNCDLSCTTWSYCRTPEPTIAAILPQERELKDCPRLATNDTNHCKELEYAFLYFAKSGDTLEDPSALRSRSFRCKVPFSPPYTMSHLERIIVDSFTRVIAVTAYPILVIFEPHLGHAISLC